MEKLTSIMFSFAGLMFFFQSYISYTKKEYIAALAFIIGGLAFIYITIKYFINIGNTSLKPNKGEVLKQTGKKIEAAILNVEHLTNIRINQRAPYVIVAQGTNPVTNQSQIFKSYYIWDDILYLLQNKKTIDIYIDPNNPKKYYMDIQTLLYNQSSNQPQNIQNNQV